MDPESSSVNIRFGATEAVDPVNGICDIAAPTSPLTSRQSMIPAHCFFQVVISFFLLVI
jgi:hypothetical protein